MADKKISQLSLASTPLAGNETLPIVQTGATVQVSVADLTAGRGISTTSLEVVAAGAPTLRVNSTDGLTPTIDLFRTGGAGYQITADSSVIFSINRINSAGAVTATPLTINSGDTATFAGAILAPGGNAAGPAFSFSTDTDTGIFRPGANILAASTGGSERMRISSTGNVGIGTTSPSANLEVVAAGAPTLRVNSTDGLTPTIDLFRTGGAGYQITADSSVIFSINRINSAGAVTATPLTINSGDTATFAGTILAPGANAAGPAFSFSADTDTGIFQAGANILAASTGGSERMRIDSSGNVGIGTLSPNAAARLDVTSTTSGFLPPRMTEAQRDLIATPPDGLMLYNTTTNKLQVRAAGAWVDLH